MCGDSAYIEWLEVVPFAQIADDLVRRHKGDLVARTGRIVRSRFTDRAGNQRLSWAVTVKKIVTTRAVRPNGGITVLTRRTFELERRADGHASAHNANIGRGAP